jgi:phosphinothricin acetyltransferase
MSFVHCNFEKHGPTILEIFNDVIANSTALYETKSRSLAEIKRWFELKAQDGYTVLGYENEQGELLGFVAYGRFRPQPATDQTVEHSLYIHKKSRGQKIGKKLLEQYLQHVIDKGYHTTIAAIDSENIPCIELHKKYGFKSQGKIFEVARKFDHWLDLEYYQLILSKYPLSDDQSEQN